MRSDFKKLDSFTSETSKNHLIRNFLRNERLRVKYYRYFEKWLLFWFWPLMWTIVVDCHFSGFKHYCGTLPLSGSLKDFLFNVVFLKHGQYFVLRRYNDSNLAILKHGHYLDFDHFRATLPLFCFLLLFQVTIVY